ncbi:excinuclease ABC subunit UvrA [Lentisphaerota bacterium ZTH]|nr:excinuclease ABC subunit UvrA [Lentisphaerota bacterium]WET05456.1 excinuclease ABC subunit UvrA [Lentisphaerota bacterium ZTH]
MLQNIYIKGAAQHNLKAIDVEIPRNKLTVITGLSGSGKSSLAFDTLYAEGQRRYVESLSAYARQFLDRLQKPKVDHIEGLSPAIAIEQRTAGSNPRSTVATVTEIYDYLRLLYAHTGIPHCPECGKELKSQSAQSITARIMEYPADRKLMLLAPFVSGRKGEHREILEKISSEGFVRARIDGEFVLLDEKIPKLEKNIRHSIEAVVDRLVTGSLDASRLNDSVEVALKHGDGILTVLIENDVPDGPKWIEEQISEHLACLDCSVSFGQLQPRNFSFNSPYGACPECSGLGVLMVMNPELVVPDTSLSIKKGAIPGWRRGPRRLIIYYNMLLRKLSEHFNYPEMLTTPFKDLPDKIRRALLFGTEENLEFDYVIRGRRFHWSKPFEGILANMQRRMEETESDSVRDRLRKYLSPHVCPKCNGARLNPVSLAVTVGGAAINEVNALSVEKSLSFFQKLELSREGQVIAGEVLREICSRLGFLNDVGLSYLTLDRQSGTLSGGEAQRIRLATQLGCGLVGVLYILDEPSIGLHQRDNDRLLDTLERLRDIGNTVVVVEHDLDTIMRADYVLDLGPGAGRHGGEVVAHGTPAQVKRSKKSLTGNYISGKKEVPVPEARSRGTGNKLTIKGARHNNLKNVDIDIPLGTFCCVTGVSGSGKSSLINEILTRGLHKHLKIGDEQPGEHDAIKGLKHIDKAIVIDQSPIGRTPRSNPATYTDAFAHIRKLFAELPESKVRGYKPGRFSFNVKGGRCEDCRGDGIKKIEMQFLSDVYVECATCGGKRFNAETLNIRFKKMNIADVLDMTVNQAAEFFEKVPPLYRKLKTLQDVGLGYVHLGQPATTLSGGEAQRVKLASELSRIPRGHTIYILDEPTTGLHIADIEKLLEVLLKLRDMGNTVLVIEHNLDVIKTADHVIDLGPEGGDAGGRIIASGTPEEVAASEESYTGEYLRHYLK